MPAVAGCYCCWTAMPGLFWVEIALFIAEATGRGQSAAGRVAQLCLDTAQSSFAPRDESTPEAKIEPSDPRPIDARKSPASSDTSASGKSPGSADAQQFVKWWNDFTAAAGRCPSMPHVPSSSSANRPFERGVIWPSPRCTFRPGDTATFLFGGQTNDDGCILCPPVRRVSYIASKLSARPACRHGRSTPCQYRAAMISAGDGAKIHKTALLRTMCRLPGFICLLTTAPFSSKFVDRRAPAQAEHTVAFDHGADGSGASAAASRQRSAGVDRPKA